MKITIFVLLTSLGMAAQAVPKPTPMPTKIVSRKPVTVTDPARDNPILVLFGQQRRFVKTVESVTDTLPKNLRYRILTHNDSIARYSNSRFVKKVLLIPKT